VSRRLAGRARTADRGQVVLDAAAGLGVAVIPGLALVNRHPGVVVHPLAADAPVRHVSAVRPRDGYRSRAVTTMLESLGAAAAEFA